MPEDMDEQIEQRSLTPEDARNLEPGCLHYRAYVGSPRMYDEIAASQFAIMTALGLRDRHTLLDIGCGSLCAGRLFIPYLLQGRYHGIEPQQWLVDDGVKYEVTKEQLLLKRPRFHISSDFDCEYFGVKFDFAIAHSVLTHASQAHIHRCLSQVSATLKPRGLFAASFHWDGKSTYDGEDWIYPAFTSFPAKIIVGTAESCGLKTWPLLLARTYSHYWLVFSKKEASESAWLDRPMENAKFLSVLELRRQVHKSDEKYDTARKELEEVREELALLKEQYLLLHSTLDFRRSAD